MNAYNQLVIRIFSAIQSTGVEQPDYGATAGELR